MGWTNSDEFDSVFVLQVSTGLGAVLSVGFVSWVLRGGALGRYALKYRTDVAGFRSAAHVDGATQDERR